MRFEAGLCTSLMNVQGKSTPLFMKEDPSFLQKSQKKKKKKLSFSCTFLQDTESKKSTLGIKCSLCKFVKCMFIIKYNPISSRSKYFASHDDIQITEGDSSLVPCQFVRVGTFNVAQGSIGPSQVIRGKAIQDLLSHASKEGKNQHSTSYRKQRGGACQFIIQPFLLCDMHIYLGGPRVLVRFQECLIPSWLVPIQCWRGRQDRFGIRYWEETKQTHAAVLRFGGLRVLFPKAWSMYSLAHIT